MNETHDGNLNRSKIEATGKEGMKSAGKSNGEEATLRKGNLPKAEAVKTVDKDANKGKAIKCAEKQNISDENPKMINQVPSGKKHPTTTSSGNCGCK